MKGDVRIVRFKSSVAAKAAWAGRRNAVIATATSAARRASGELKRFRMGDLDDYPILPVSDSLINPSDRVFTKVFRGLYLCPARPAER